MEDSHTGLASWRKLARGSLPLAAAAAAMLLAALAWADWRVSRGASPFEWLLAPLDLWVAVGGELREKGDAWISLARGPATLLAVVVLAGVAVRRVPLREAQRLPAALLLAALGQAWLQHSLVVAFFAHAAAALALCWRREPPAPAGGRTGPGGALWIAAMLALLLLASLVGLDLVPPLYFDEQAYLRAARMQAGLIEPSSLAEYKGTTLYRLEQFQSEAVPFGLQTLFVRLTHVHPLSIRLASVFAVFTAIALLALVLRRRLGDAAVALMIAFSALAPLTLGYARAGLYVSVSVLHGALGLACLLWYLERRGPGRAAVLSLLLGTSLYHYQLFWFVPVFAALAIAASPDTWRRSFLRRDLFWLCGPFVVSTLLGTLAFGAGLEAVQHQTFDRAVWAEDAGGADRGFGVVASRGLEPGAAFTSLESEMRAQGLEVQRQQDAERAMLLFHGDSRVVADLLRRAREEGLLAFDQKPPPSDGVLERGLVRARRMLLRLVRDPGWESAGRWTDGPVLNPLLVPLVFVGFLELLRRAGRSLPRTLAIWLVAAALLPATLGGALPRRAALLVPSVAVVAALPLLPWLARARRGGPAGWLLALALAGFLAAVLATDAHRYFAGGQLQVAQADGTRPLPVLELVKAMERVPTDELVLVAAPPRTLSPLYGSSPPAGRDMILEVQGVDARTFRNTSCLFEAPFTWLVPASRPLARDTLDDVLSRDFVVSKESVLGHELLRVLERRPGACGGREPG